MAHIRRSPSFSLDLIPLKSTKTKEMATNTPKLTQIGKYQYDLEPKYTKVTKNKMFLEDVQILEAEEEIDRQQALIR
ncbi:hypothetical protein CVT26_004509, partial [Gymnopilus dilepis]